MITEAETTTACHVVAMPSPGRGHINPMMNLCKLLASKSDDILISFVVTEEWLELIDSEPIPKNIRFCSIPNVLPSEKERGVKFGEFMDAVWTKMEAPFDQLLDGLKPPAALILADTNLFWAVSVGNRRNIPVASFWPMSASVLTVLQHFHLFEQNGHFPLDSEKGHERVDYIPGVSSTRLFDMPLSSASSPMYQYARRFLNSFKWLHKAQYLLLSSLYELESPAMDILGAKVSLPVYSIGPAIPYLSLVQNHPESPSKNEPGYFNWLDNQPKSSVLYISLGSFVPVSSDQIDEIAAGLNDSGVRFLWVARGETERLKEACADRGFVVPWCDQLRVLSHSSIGGFWSHCGWNSVQEGLFAGVPFLTFPLIADQTFDSKLIVEDWQIGWRMTKEGSALGKLVTREEIAKLVREFMDLERDEVKEFRRRAKELQGLCLRAVAEGGSSERNISSFIRSISSHCGRH